MVADHHFEGDPRGEEVPGVPRRSVAVPDYTRPGGEAVPGYTRRPDGAAVHARNCSQTSL